MRPNKPILNTELLLERLENLKHLFSDDKQLWERVTKSIEERLKEERENES